MDVHGGHDPDGRSSVGTLPAGGPAIPAPAARHTRMDDQLLVARLARNDFRGPEYDLVAAHLVRVGFRCCRSWLRTGEMIVRCREQGRPVGPLPAGIDQQDLDDLAIDTAVEGRVLFHREALVRGGWRPDGGASLLTYYIGACINVYPAIHRRWVREHRGRIATVPHETPVDPGHPGFESHVLLMRTLKAALGRAEWRALTMNVDGFSYKEIGAELGRTERSVEALLRKARKKAADIIERSGGHHV